MSDAFDPRWPRLLGLSVHECRTPLGVVVGYVRLLLGDRVGPLNDQQRHMLREAEKSCDRLTAILAEMSDVSHLESQTAPFNRRPLKLGPLVDDVVRQLPIDADREATVAIELADMAAEVVGDATRLRAAFTSILVGVRREMVPPAGLHVRQVCGDRDGHPASWITIGSPAASGDTAPGDRLVFDEWRGGTGLSLAVARRAVEAHGGAVWGPRPGAGPGALIVLPHA